MDVDRALSVILNVLVIILVAVLIVFLAKAAGIA